MPTLIFQDISLCEVLLPKVHSALVDAGVTGVDIVKHKPPGFTLSPDGDGDGEGDDDDEGDHGDDGDSVGDNLQARDLLVFFLPGAFGESKKI